MSSDAPASEAHADAARTLLEKAGSDLAVIQKLADDRDIPDDVIGFHAQQAVEKGLKAVLTWNGIDFRRTHDLLEVSGLCRDAGIDVPWSEEKLALLNPFAVEFRYGFAEELEDALDRNGAQTVAEEVLTWAKKLIVPVSDN